MIKLKHLFIILTLISLLYQMNNVFQENEEEQDGPSLESSSYLNVTLRYLGPFDLGNLGPLDTWTLGLSDFRTL